MVSFYGWNHADRFIAAWKAEGFTIVGHLVFTKRYSSKSAFVGYRHECAYLLAKGRPCLPESPLPDVLGWNYTGIRRWILTTISRSEDDLFYRALLRQG